MERSEYEDLARDNYGLVVSFMDNNNLDRDEWHYEVSIAYLAALRNHDPNKGALSTYFHMIARNRVNKIRVKENKRAERIGEPRLTSELNDFRDSGTLDDYGLDQVEWIDLLSDFELKIAKMLYEGYSQTEIAEMLDTPKGTINSSIHRLREKLRKEGISS